MVKVIYKIHFIDDPIFLAFDTFNVASNFDIEKRIKCICLKGILWSTATVYFQHWN